MIKKERKKERKIEPNLKLKIQKEQKIKINS
jgi:hypothetical protein